MSEFCQNALKYQNPYHVNATAISDQLKCSAYFYSQAASSHQWARSLTIAYLVLGIMIGVIGNILVIIAASKYGTMKLDRVTIMLVKNLAIADLGIVLMYDMPMLVTHVAREWVLGLYMCYVVGFGFMVPAMANLLFAMMVSIHRYIRCKWPLKASIINPQRTQLFVLSSWTMCGVLWISYSLATRLKLEFLGSISLCIYTFLEVNRTAHFVFMCTTLINCFMMMFTNVSMWLMVKDSFSSQPRRNTRAEELSGAGSTSEKRDKGSNKHQNKALLTTTAVTSMFLVTWIPTLIRYFMVSWPFHIVFPPTALDKAMPFTFSLGSWFNPLIYTAINRGFREFVKGKVKVQITALSFNTHSGAM